MTFVMTSEAGPRRVACVFTAVRVLVPVRSRYVLKASLERSSSSFGWNVLLPEGHNQSYTFRHSLSALVSYESKTNRALRCLSEELSVVHAGSRLFVVLGALAGQDPATSTSASDLEFFATPSAGGLVSDVVSSCNMAELLHY